jgi:hypothetical protein
MFICSSPLISAERCGEGVQEVDSQRNTYRWSQLGFSSQLDPKTLDKKTVQHNVDDGILTKQIFPGAQR